MPVLPECLLLYSARQRSRVLPWAAYRGVAHPHGVSSAHRIPGAGFAYSHLVILSADKELFLQDRCRRSARNGYRCRPDGPWRGERIPGQRQTPRLLPPMETAEESVHERRVARAGRACTTLELGAATVMA